MVFTLLVASLFSTITVDDLHSHYGEIFRTGNRNAASHMWASWILAQAHQLSSADLERLFSGFCPVSGSPVNPSEYNTYHYKLRSLVPGAEHASGFMHHCCAPCVCDTHDMIRADTKTVSLASGSATLTFAVIGDPCKRASTLERTFTDPFSGSETTLGATAPEVQCDANGKLKGATYSDHSAVIIGLLGAAPALNTPGPSEPTPGRVTTVGGQSFQDSREYSGFCASRALQGYNSGMGMIFRQVAQMSPLEAPASASTIGAPSSVSAIMSTKSTESSRYGSPIGSELSRRWGVGGDGGWGAWGL